MPARRVDPSDDTGTVDVDVRARRPPSVAFASLVTSIVGLWGALSSYTQLQVVQFASAPTLPDPLQNAFVRATWEFEQAHRRAVVVLGALTLVLSTFLLVASARVFARARGAGALWRQALAGNVACAAVTVWAERGLVGARLAALRAVFGTAPHLPGAPAEVTLDDLARGSLHGAWMVMVVLALTLLFANRARTRAAIG